MMCCIFGHSQTSVSILDYSSTYVRSNLFYEYVCSNCGSVVRKNREATLVEQELIHSMKKSYREEECRLNGIIQSLEAQIAEKNSIGDSANNKEK